MVNHYNFQNSASNATMTLPPRVNASILQSLSFLGPQGFGPKGGILSYAQSVTSNDPHHLITFAATLLSSPPSSALITILPFTSPPLRPLCIHSTFINAIIHLRPFFNRPPIIYVVSSFRA